MRRSIPAGLFDSGFAALATFAVTIYGARVMPTETFGFFALFWAAFLMAAIVPAQMWFQPWEIAAAQLAVEERVSFLRQAIRFGLAVALIAALFAAGLASMMATAAPPEIVFPFAASLVIAAIISPIQDFVRRILHVANRSERAALVSLVQFAGTLTALAGLSFVGVSNIWIPFSALTLANVCSITVGLLLARGGEGPTSPRLRWRAIIRSGSWLLILGLIVPLVGLLVNWLVISIAGAALMGLAEASRIVGRPVLVVTTGLGLALRPRSYEAAGAGDLRGARRIRRVFTVVTLAGGLLYTAMVSFPWSGNVMIDLVPKGFEIAGLVPAICLANALVGVSFPARYELIALRREGYTTLTEIVGQTLKTSAALGAGVIGGFVIPLGEALLGLARLLGYRPALRGAYGRKDDTSALPDTDGLRDFRS